MHGGFPVPVVCFVCVNNHLVASSTLKEHTQHFYLNLEYLDAPDGLTINPTKSAARVSSQATGGGYLHNFIPSDSGRVARQVGYVLLVSHARV